ncbi:MAG: cupin domain-containing protein [Anaerolineae bacterium]|nr:cupin domain-containing protein [Anaerolineae bacterium]
MAINNQTTVRIKRWEGSHHPTMAKITQLMQADGLRPYMWTNMPNHRYAVRSHGFHKVLYVIEGNLELILPDSNERVKMRAGDRAEIPAGVRHGTIVGTSGAKCVEASLNRRPGMK